MPLPFLCPCRVRVFMSSGHHPMAGRGRRAADPPTVRHKCGTSAAQVRHKCGTSAAQVRHKCGTSAAQVRHKCGTSAEQVRSTVRIACGTPADVRRGVFWQKHPQKNTKTPPKAQKHQKRRKKAPNFFSPAGLFAGTRADSLRNGGGTGAAPVRHRCGTGADRVRTGGGPAADRRRTGGGPAADRRRICGAASSDGRAGPGFLGGTFLASNGFAWPPPVVSGRTLQWCWRCGACQFGHGAGGLTASFTHSKNEAMNYGRLVRACLFAPRPDHHNRIAVPIIQHRTTKIPRSKHKRRERAVLPVAISGCID